MQNRAISSLSVALVALGCLALSGALVACGASGTSGEPGEDPNGLLSGKGDETSLTHFAADGTPPSVVGSYRFELLSEVTTREIGGFGTPEDTTNTTRMEGVIEAVQNGTQVTFYIGFCGVYLPEVSGYEPRVDSETIRRLPAVVSQAELFDSGTSTVFQTDPSAWVIGAGLSDVLLDAMPDSDEDPRVEDVDLDGEPGITMMLGNWKIYGAMRVIFKFAGEIGEGGLLSGSAEVGMDTAVFGDTVPLINVAKKIKKMQEETEVVAEHHVFEMTPFQAFEVTCEQAFDGAPILVSQMIESGPTSEPEVPVSNPGGPVTDCLQELDDRGIEYELASSPMENPDGYPELVCEIEDPVLVDLTLADVTFHYADPDAHGTNLYTSCAIALVMHDMAQIAAAEGITDIVHLGSYNCRTIAGTPSLSQHGLGQAIDIGGVRFMDGTYWTVAGDWEVGMDFPVTEAGEWWRWFVGTLHTQRVCNILLTPDYDAEHHDHVHCDLTPGEHLLL